MITAILVSYNTAQLTCDCIETLLPDLAPVHGRVLLVDNGSCDHTIDMVRGRFPSVEVIRNRDNIGFGAANNLGFKGLNGCYCLLLNTDTRVKTGAIEKMIDVLEHNPSVGVVGCRLENDDGTLQKSCWSFPTPIRAWIETLGLNRFGLTTDWHRWDHESEQDVDFVIGAALMVRREVIEQVGGFDESFFLYAEETDWQRRIHDAGWRVRFTPACTVVHVGGASGAAMKDRQLVESCRSTHQYIRKHHGVLGAEFFRVGVILGISIRIVLLSIKIGPGRRDGSRRNVLVRTLKWWCGCGPRSGFRELACNTSTSEKVARA